MNTELNNNIGEVLKLQRIKSGMKRKHICQQLLRIHDTKLAPGQLRLYEEGRSIISTNMLYKIANILDIEMSVFFEKSDPAILITTRTERLLESYLQITYKPAQDALFFLIRHLAKGK